MKPARVVLYTRPDCHLCLEVKQQILKANCPELYTLQEINIEDDRELLQKYRYDIPVVAINGVEAFRHRLSSEEFRATLLRKSGGKPPFLTMS